ncbi:E3 SUMO-protein ligase ZBED1-like [Cyprinodon tularosa]|uniref:E3 SUMO-protein ligase ZBED1-like n=1 Tax=Cyprinodon tularosa TaxID=77115 RepID=UPI0018E1F344|nr:E3 SUMO-protein ligase ZBED1-like [Cyprinodon tularosa]
MAEGGGEVPQDLVPKRGSSSVIWNWFGFKKSDTEQKVVLCKVCRQPVTTKDSNTTNLFHHLKHKHKPEYEASQKMRCDAAEASTKTSFKKPTSTQTKLADAFSHSTPYDSQSKRWKELTEAVAFCLAKDMLPLQSVEKEGFRRMVHKMDTRYKMPSRKYFSKTALPKMYDECRDGLQAKLSTVTFFASTTDMWSSRATEPYISLTVHYITDDWSLNSNCLQTSFFPEDHTGENIASGLKQFLQEWKLDEAKQVCVTTDSGANVVKAVALNKWTRLSCFGHNLHIAVERSMRDSRIDRAVGVSKKIVSLFSHSWKRQRALKAAQEELGLPQHKLVTESPTRWGSRQRMIQRLLEQEKAITQVLAAEWSTRHLVLKWQDVDVLDAVSKALGPLLDFTDALSSESYVTVSCLKPILHLFSSKLLQEKDEDSDLTKTIKKSVLDYLTTKYSDPDVVELINMASFLDPRFRTQHLSQEEIQVIKAKVVTEGEPVSATPSGPAETCQGQETEDKQQRKKQRKSLGSFLKKAAAAEVSTSVPYSDRVEAELSSYLFGQLADSESDPLAWWKVHEVNFPLMSQLAKKYLCIPATSTASERVFSAGGNVVTCQRSLLKPATVDMLVFLTKNLKV